MVREVIMIHILDEEIEVQRDDLWELLSRKNLEQG